MGHFSTPSIEHPGFSSEAEGASVALALPKPSTIAIIRLFARTYSPAPKGDKSNNLADIRKSH